MNGKKRGSGTVLAFDFGTSSIGVAVGSELTGTASMLPALKARDGIPAPEGLGKLLAEWEPDLIVVGLPLNMDGTYQEVTFRAKKFGNRLAAQSGLRVVFKDERLTTKSAREYLYGSRGSRGLTKGNVDSASAVLILESFFEENRLRD